LSNWSSGVAQVGASSHPYSLIRFLQYYSLMPNCFSEQDTPDPFQDLSQHRRDIKQSVKDLLHEISTEPLPDEICLRCGQQMKYIDTTLWFYGEDHSFQIRLPVCGCRPQTAD
jgi:hypothetical protein